MYWYAEHLPTGKTVNMSEAANKLISSIEHNLHCTACAHLWPDVDPSDVKIFAMPERRSVPRSPKYDLAQIAREVHATAQGETYHGNSLLVAKEVPGVTDIDRSLLDRWLTGRNAGAEDRFALQRLALDLKERGLNHA